MQCHQSQLKRSSITLRKVTYRPAKGQLLNIKTYSVENQTVKNVSSKSCTGTYAQGLFAHGSCTNFDWLSARRGAVLLGISWITAWTDRRKDGDKRMKAVRKTYPHQPIVKVKSNGWFGLNRRTIANIARKGVSLLDFFRTFATLPAEFAILIATQRHVNFTPLRIQQQKVEESRFNHYYQKVLCQSTEQ